ncbi:MAG: ATP-binding protein [Candidatus Paceibacterales bacterium]
MEITSSISIILGIVNLFLGVLIFLKNRTNIINILYGLLALSVTIWTFSIYFFRASADTTLFWSKIAYLSAGASAFLFLYFTLYFPFKTKLNSLWHIFSVTYALILTWLITGTREILKSYAMVNHTHGLLFGRGYILYNLFIFIFFGFGFLNLVLKYFKSGGITKIQIKLVLIGSFLTVLIATITNLILFGMGIFEYNWVGPSSTILLVSFFAYAITKYHLFEIRVILTEFLVGLTGLILLVQALIAETLWWKILGFILLFLFGISGYFLIQSVLKEIALRAELQKAYVELERLDKAKSEFISIASHQLRTPLTAIKGYISMILEGTYGKLSKRIERPMENVNKSNERLIKLINDILDVSRIEAGRMEMSFEMLSLEEIITNVVEELKFEAKKKNIYLNWKKPENPLPKTLADRDKIRQVVLNIVDNAIRYTNKGGVKIELKTLDEKAQIKVSDTGVGIRKEELSKMFKSFSRGMAGTRLYTEGVGLGLYIARKFVEMHQGRIWAKSKGESEGSTFYVELPLSR